MKSNIMDGDKGAPGSPATAVYLFGVGDGDTPKSQSSGTVREAGATSGEDGNSVGRINVAERERENGERDTPWQFRDGGWRATYPRRKTA